MRDHRRVDRFIGIPFSPGGCASHSSVQVVDTRPKKKAHGDTTPPAAHRVEMKNGKQKGESLVSRLLRSFKNLSQIFAVYEEGEEEEEEREMVIGLPTDVKHVAHIGWDGSTDTSRSMKRWNRSAPDQAASISSLPTTFSVRQFELAMAAQAAAGAGAHAL